MNEVIQQAEKIGLTGQDALRFIKEQQEIQRAERQEARQEAERQREHENEVAERQRQEAERQRQHDREMSAIARPQQERTNINGKVPKLPVYVDEKDDLHSYLQRFERFARINNWPENEWAVSLSALLTGKALDVFSRLSVEDAVNYSKLKEALLKRYELNEEGYHKKFRTAKPEKGESPEQFIFRIRTYLDRWIELSKSDKSYDGMSNLIIREQFIDACPKQLSIFLKERTTNDLKELAKMADQYLSAHQSELAASARYDDNGFRNKQFENKKENNTDFRCFNCNGRSHKASECTKPKVSNSTGPWRTLKQCSHCKKYGHDEKACYFKKARAAVSVIKPQEKENEEIKEVNSGLIIENHDQVNSKITENVKDNNLLLANGEKLPIITNVCKSVHQSGNMPVAKGLVNGKEVICLRDTGCNGVVVKREFVSKNQFTGDYGYMLLVDNTVRKAPFAIIEVDSPYLKGEVKALCLPNSMYDLVIGNIPEALPPENVVDNSSKLTQEGKEENKCEENSEENTVTEEKEEEEKEEDTTRKKVSNEKKVTALAKIKENDERKALYSIGKEELKIMQEQDSSIQECIEKQQTSQRKYLKQNGLIFELKSDKNGERRSIVLPTKLRPKVMKLGHDIPMAGHLGYKKTLNRINQHFSWPGMTKQIREYCKTCDICQRAQEKGRVTPVPLGEMPVMETPFKRVAFDIIGPLPKTNDGFRYVLTLVDYSTRFPEAIPLKDISAESVANAMVSIYSRMGIPSEILSDQGRQFTAECMREVNRLLKIRHLLTTPYHPQCNGLVESFNKTLKTMIKKMSKEQPKCWNHYLDPLLFAYREVPQATTGFSPFELIYGRSVKGPLSILKEIMTDDSNEETKSCYRYFIELQSRLKQTLEIVKNEVVKAQGKQKSYYDKRTKPKDIHPGDEVLVMLPTQRNKMKMQWKGPYKVIDEPHNNDYSIKVMGKTKTYHANMLKKYYRRASYAEERPSTSCSAAVIEYEPDDGEQDSELYVMETKQTENYKDLKINENLKPEETKQLKNLINEYKLIFSNIPGDTNLKEHSINLTSDEPVVCKPYPVPFTIRDNLKKNMEEMEQMGIIRKSDSPYASPVVIVKKKDETDRICVDYRHINKMTLPDPEPMTNAEDLFSRLNGAKYFSTLDLAKDFFGRYL